MLFPRCGYTTSNKIRSNNQNRYYWSVVVAMISEHTGFGPEEMHEILKHKFLKSLAFFQTKNGGENIWITKSTKDLDTKCFEEYLSQIWIWASYDLGLWIPEPNEIMEK